MPLLQLTFDSWVCGGQKTLQSRLTPRLPWVPDEALSSWAFISEPTDWEIFNFFAEDVWLNEPGNRISPQWFNCASEDGGHVEASRLDTAIFLSPHGLEPGISLKELSELLSREFPGAAANEIRMEAMWACSDSGPRPGLLPKSSVGAIIRVSGPTLESDGYREVPPT